MSHWGCRSRQLVMWTCVIEDFTSNRLFLFYIKYAAFVLKNGIILAILHQLQIYLQTLLTPEIKISNLPEPYVISDAENAEI